MAKSDSVSMESSFVDFSDHEYPIDKEDIENYYKNIGHKLKHAREEAGYTMSDLSKTVGLSAAAIANYESGIRQISVHILSQIAVTLEKPLNYFLGPKVDNSFSINETLKRSIERYSNAKYVETIYRLDKGKIKMVDQPIPLIPFPIEIANDHSFAIAVYNKKVESDSYYLCNFYNPVDAHLKIPGKRKGKVFIPDPDTLVLALVGDTKRYELTRFDSITPSTNYKELKGDVVNKFTVNITAVIISRIERLVK